MRKIAENIYEHNGIKVEAVKVADKMPCMKCPFACNACQVDFKCSELIGRMEFVPYQEIQENIMKKSELSFKVLTMDRNRTDKIIAALEKSGIECEKGAVEAMAFEIKSGNLEYWTSPFDEDCEKFDDSPVQEVSLKEALKLIESVEPDAPEFDIKLLQPVLIRNGGADSFWNLAFFAAVKSNGIFTNEGYCREMIKLTGNESFMLERTTPAGWWECENGKPVWRTK